MKTISSPHRILFTFGVLLLLFGAFHSWLLSDLKTVDIQFHDTYFVLSNFHLYVFISILITLIGLVYWSFRKWKLNKLLTVIHVSVVVVTIVIFLAVMLNGSFTSNFEYYSFKNSGSGMLELGKRISLVNRFLFFSVASFVFSQVFYVVNLIVSFLKR